MACLPFYGTLCPQPCPIGTMTPTSRLSILIRRGGQLCAQYRSLLQAYGLEPDLQVSSLCSWLVHR